MRKLIVLSFITLDGVMQAPGGPEEDPTGGFRYGGWTVPYFDDLLGQTMTEQMSRPFDVLLGRKTYEIFAAYWPHHNDEGAAINQATKYVASHAPMELTWEHSVLLQGDVVEEVNKLKAQDGPELQVHGSGNFIQTLLKHDLVDELWLKIFPITLGMGKRLFADGATAAAFTLREAKTSPRGVIVASYDRAGEAKTPVKLSRARAQRTIITASKSSYARVNGLDMYYEIHGEGQPLVLLHGALSAIGTSFGKVQPDLAKERQSRTDRRNPPAPCFHPAWGRYPLV